MSSVLDKIERGMIYTVIKQKKCVPRREEDLEDLIQDVYLELCETIGRYDESRGGLARFVHMRLTAVLHKRYNTMKAKAKAEAISVDSDELYKLGVTPRVEDQVLLEQLKPHMCKELLYLLENPYGKDFGNSSKTPCKGGILPPMSYEYIGDIMGISRVSATRRIKKNVEQLRAMI